MKGVPGRGGCLGVPDLETVSLMGRNSPMNDFCALGLSAPVSVSELVGLWGDGYRAMGLGVCLPKPWGMG